MTSSARFYWVTFNVPIHQLKSGTRVLMEIKPRPYVHLKSFFWAYIRTWRGLCFKGMLNDLHDLEKAQPIYPVMEEYKF